MKNKYLTIQELRQTFRTWLDESGSKSSFPEGYYHLSIQAHFNTLHKYLTQFNNIYYKEKGRRLKKEFPSIRDIYTFLIRNKKTIIDEFVYYLKHKTHFSYDIFHQPHPIKLKTKLTKEQYLKKLEERSEKDAYKGKTAEFIILILAEYIILHNYMFASKLKLKEVKSIDTFLKEI